MSSEPAALLPSSGSSSLSPSELLEKAHDVIVERGWCQNSFEDREGRVCALGALAAAVNDGQATFSPWVLAIGRLDVHAKAKDLLFREADFVPAPQYNDHPSTSKEDVLLLFKRAAERARLEGH